MNNKLVRTRIMKSLNGHKVQFTIGNQSFNLKECEEENGMTSLEYAKWYQQQLDTAFETLIKLAKESESSQDVMGLATCKNCGSFVFTMDGRNCASCHAPVK